MSLFCNTVKNQRSVKRNMSNTTLKCTKIHSSRIKLVAVRRQVMTGHTNLKSCLILNMYVEVVSHVKLEKFVYRQLDHKINDYQSIRVGTTPVHTPVTDEQQRRIEQLSTDLEKFRSEDIVSPINSCFLCHHLTYIPPRRIYVTYETVEDLISPLYSHPTNYTTS